MPGLSAVTGPADIARLDRLIEDIRRDMIGVTNLQSMDRMNLSVHIAECTAANEKIFAALARQDRVTLVLVGVTWGLVVGVKYWEGIAKLLAIL